MDQKGYTILVCDDDKDILESISIYLTNEGYRVITANDGRQAVLSAQAEEIHLILMDIMMPGTDGIKAMARIREDKNIPVILLSAKDSYSDKALGLNMGADDYITKPFDAIERLPVSGRS